jgi:hypothetical protein
MMRKDVERIYEEVRSYVTRHHHHRAASNSIAPLSSFPRAINLIYLQKMELSMFISYCHLGELQKAREMMRGIMEKSLDTKIYNTLLFYHIKFFSLHENLSIFREMEKKAILNSFTYSLLFLKLLFTPYNDHSPIISQLYQSMKEYHLANTLTQVNNARVIYCILPAVLFHLLR